MHINRHSPPGDNCLCRRIAKTGAIGACLLFVVSVAGCIGALGSGTPPAVWATGPSRRVLGPEIPDPENAYYARRDNVVRLSGAAGETVAFELVVTAASGTAAGLELTADNLTGPGGTISADGIRAYQQMPVTIARFPNWYLRKYGLSEQRSFPDALVPLPVTRTGAAATATAGRPLTVRAGSSAAIHVEVTIPSEAEAGDYKTTLSLTSGGRYRVATPVELRVRPIRLRQQDALPVAALVQVGPILAAETNLDPHNLRVALESPEARMAIQRVITLFHDHGITASCPEIKPRLTQAQSGAAGLDWTAYDDFCGPMIDGAVFSDNWSAWRWPIPADMLQPRPAQYGGMDSAMYLTLLKDYLAQCAAHFAEKGWLESGFVYFDYPTNDNPAQEDMQRVRRLIAAAHQGDRRMTFVSTLIPQSMRPFGWFEHRYEDLTGEVDVWATPARYQHPATLERLQGMGKKTWLLPDRPPFSGSLAVEAPLVHARSLAWQAFLQGHEAIFLPHTTQWPEDLMTRSIEEPEQRSDTWLVYPGRFFGVDGPVPSMRLKQLRIGLQEYRYLRLLESLGRAETARLLAGSLIKAVGSDAYGDNYQDALPNRRVDDAALWDVARRILMDETEIASGGAAADARLEANRGDWVELLGATRRLDAWVESARVKALPKEGYAITFDAVVRTELRTPVDGNFAFAALPSDAEKMDTETRVTGLQEMGVAKRRLAVKTPQLPVCDLEGHFNQPITFDAGGSGVITTPAVLSMVQVRPVEAPIRVDGRLADWPPGAQNVAGDFRIIGADENPERPRAEHQTIAYFCQDGDTLYIGIHASAPSGSWLGDTRKTNVVAYEDLRPTSGDLVEIMIDPTGAATRPDDLYHIVVQSTGDPVFEQGVSVSPPIGKVGTWPGKRPEYAVTREGSGWTAEVAINISALGKTSGPHRIWGVNLARLEPERGEYSDWARAPRYCYDPRTCGNLIWPASGPARRSRGHAAD